MFVFGHRRGAVLACRRESTVPYALRGLLFCAACGRRMQGAAPVGKRTTRIRYGCELGTSPLYLQTSAITRAPATSVKTR